MHNVVNVLDNNPTHRDTANNQRPSSTQQEIIQFFFLHKTSINQQDK
jgi:hypothetical protein